MDNVSKSCQLRRIYWLKLTGLVQRSVATQRLCYIHRINQVNSHNGSATMTATQIVVTINTIIIIRVHLYFHDKEHNWHALLN